MLKTTGAAAVTIPALSGCIDDEPGADVEIDGDGEVDEEVEISFWLSIGGDSAALAEEMADEFSEMSDTITVNTVQEGDYYDVWNQTLQGVRAEDPPNVVHLNAIHTLPAAANDVVIPIDTVLGDMIDDVEFLDEALNYYVYDDMLQAVPFGMSSICLMYNVDAFEEADLATDPMEAPTFTFDQVRESSQTLVDADATPQGVTWPVHTWWTEAWFAMQNQNFVNNDNGRSAPATEIHLDSDAAHNIYEWHQGLHQDDLYLNAGFHGWGDARSGFLNEQVGIHMDSSSAIASMIDGANEAGFEARVGHVPSQERDERHGLVIGGGALFVPVGIEGAELEATAEFLLWMSQPEQQARWHRGTGYYPVTQGSIDLLESEGFYEENPGFLLAFNHLIESTDSPATAGAMTMGHGEIRQTIDDTMMGRLFDDDPDPVSDVLGDLKEELDEHLGRMADRDPRSS